MSSSQEVRRRVNRETVNRIFDDKTYFGGTQTAAGRRMASEQGKVLIWFAPDSSHAIFFVNNFGVCEFHSDDPVSLLMEVLHYTVDWFNDPRKGAERREYAVFVGRSGFPFIYMIWGEMIRISNDPRLPPGTRVLEIDGRGPTSVEELAARLEYTGAFHSSGIANVEPTKTTPRDVKALVTPYISETSALKAGFNGGLKEYLSKDADAYLGALVAAGYAASPKTAYSLLRAGPSILRTSSVRIMQLLAKEAMEGKRKAVTLFYPALYGENGALLSSGPSSEGPDANTGFALLEQIKAYASALDDGATVRIIDGSLFRKAVAQSAIISPSIRAAMGFVPAPWAALRAQFQRLGKSNVKIELLVPPFPDLMPAFEQATVHVDGMPDVELVPGERGTVYENLQVHIAPGSTLVLWQDQDRAQYDRVFGERVGARGVASAIATMMPFIKRVVVEASVHDTGAGDARPGDPDVLREEVVQDLTSRISQAGTNLEQVLAILKVDAADLPQFVKVAQGNLTPKELAEDYLRLIASKYKVETAKQFVYGSRSTSWTTPPVLMNRGRSRHR
jgi:hypothetical protein